jgi:hypothetical protein
MMASATDKEERKAEKCDGDGSSDHDSNDGAD